VNLKKIHPETTDSQNTAVGKHKQLFGLSCSHKKSAESALIFLYMYIYVYICMSQGPTPKDRTPNPDCLYPINIEIENNVA